MTFNKALILAAAVSAGAACNNRIDSTGNRAPNDRAAAEQKDPQSTVAANRDSSEMPITVAGCLQKGDGRSDYILTRLNEPSQKSVGTSGTPQAVEREQQREAANAYRIDPTGDVKIDELVGKQVRVSGILVKKADLPKRDESA